MGVGHFRTKRKRLRTNCRGCPPALADRISSTSEPWPLRRTTPMKIRIFTMLAVGWLVAHAALAQGQGASPATRSDAAAANDARPAWMQRGAKGAGHAAMAPLAGSWRVELSIYGTMGRSPDLPPIVST